MDKLKEELQSVREDKDLLAATQEISKREMSEVTRLRQDLETSKKGLVELEEVKKERDDIKAEMKDLKSDLETAQVWPLMQVYSVGFLKKHIHMPGVQIKYPSSGRPFF